MQHYEDDNTIIGTYVPKKTRKPKAYSTGFKETDPNIINPAFYEKRKIHQAGLIMDEKYTNRSKQGVLIDDIVFQDPYPQAYKARLANAYEFDSIIRTGIDTLVHYILGRDFEPKLRPVTREKPRVEKEFGNILAELDILSIQEQEQLLDFINHVDHTCKLKLALKPLLTQKYVFGRSAALMERASDSVHDSAELTDLGFTEETPLHLKVLHSYYLGQNHYNTKTWEIEQIEYDNPNWIRDPSKGVDEQPALEIEDLIYLTHSDNNVIPNGHGYGMSSMQSILALSGANRRLNERVLPELNTAAWAGTGVFKFSGMSSKQMDEFVNQVLPSTWKATNQQIQYIPIKLDFDGDWLLEQRDSNVKHIATQLRIPSFLVNFEDVTNRSIGDRVSNIWQQGDLEFARDELRDQLWEFWYRRLMEQYFPDSEFLHLRAKIVVEFQSIDFSNFFEKAIAAGNLVQNMIITIDEARELLNRPPYPEDQMQFQELVQKYVQAHPEILQGTGLIPPVAEQGEGTIGQQGLSANVNPQKVKTGDFDSGDVLNRVKKGVRQAKNFR